MIAIDTNVFVYAFDATEPEKQSKARQFFQDVFASAAATIIPWEVAVELLARFRKWEGAGKMTSDDVQARFGEFLNVWRLALPNTKVFEISFRIRRVTHCRTGTVCWLLACNEAGTTRLYSEDMQHGANYDGVEIVNPFL